MIAPVTSLPPVAPVRRDDQPVLLGGSVDLPPGAVRDAQPVEAPDDVLHAFEQALNDLLPDTLPPQTRLMIEVDPDTRRFVYKSIDAQSGEVVRQWPSDDILRMVRLVRDLAGIAVDGKI